MSIDDPCPGCGSIIRHGPARAGTMVGCPACGLGVQLPALAAAPLLARTRPLEVRDVTSVVGTVEMVRAAERISDHLTAIRRYVGWIAVAAALWVGITFLALLNAMTRPIAW